METFIAVFIVPAIIAIVIATAMYLFKWVSETSQLAGEGQIIHASAANHFLGYEGRGGKLTLTQDRLIFESHGINSQNQALIIPLQECASVSTCNLLFIVPNGLRIVTKSGKQEFFALWGRKTWVEAIQKAMDESGGGRTLEKLSGQEPN